MLTLVEQVRRTIRREALVEPGDRLLVALSGGADSVALLHVLRELVPELGATVCGAAHLNHRLRPSADADEAFCRDLAASFDLPFVAAAEDVAAVARHRKASIEDAARSVRYTFLTRAANELGASRVAVAHTRNDQAETVLLRLFRGAGPAGLAGIRARRGNVVRPLLDVARADLEAWLTARGIQWREDPSNRDVAFARNRIRHELLPWLVRHFGPGIVDVLSRQATLSAEDGTWLNGQATESGIHLVLRSDGARGLEIAALAPLPRPLQRRLAYAALRVVAGERFVGMSHVDAVLTIAGLDGGGAEDERAVADLPGQRVSREAGWLVFRAVDADPGRQGRRRGRPVSNMARGASTDAELHGTARQSGAEGATLKGHAPEGGRG